MLFYRQEDLGLRKFFASGSPDETALRKVATLVSHADGPVEPRDLADEMDLTNTRLSGLVNLLEQAGAVEVRADGTLDASDDDLAPKQAAKAAAEVAESHKKVEKSRLTMMQGYAETQGCRRQYLLAYFGEQLDETCGNCDTCAAGTAQEQPDALDSPFELQSRVVHNAWGERHRHALRGRPDRGAVRRGRLQDAAARHRGRARPAEHRVSSSVSSALEVDAVVVGGGPAGLAAASWLGRYRRSVVVLDSGEYRSGMVERSHGYLGRDPQKPVDLIERGREEVLAYPTAQVRRGVRVDVRARARDDGLFEVGDDLLAPPAGARLRGARRPARGRGHGRPLRRRRSSTARPATATRRATATSSPSAGTRTWSASRPRCSTGRGASRS